jgi:hypothetical protein
MFNSEKDMQISFEAHLRTKFESDEAIIASQVDGLFGIPDVVLLEPPHGQTGHVVAMELKLSAWKKALVQAFRYRSFAWESYVVLDACRANVARSKLDEFRKRNIGLATYSSCCEFVVHCRPSIRRPYSPQLSEKIVSLFHKDSVDRCSEKQRPSRASGLGKAFLETTGKRMPISAHL